jgi:hypothetical protein
VLLCAVQMDSVKCMVKHQIGAVEGKLEGLDKMLEKVMRKIEKVEGQNKMLEKMMGKIGELFLSTQQVPEPGVAPLSGGSGPMEASEIQAEG